MTEPEERLYSAETSSITIPAKRQRRTFDRGELNRLKSSMEAHGQLQPGVCFLDPKTKETVLIAGHRRLLICQELGLPFKYILNTEILDPYKRKEMELHENTVRTALTFQEEADARAELHKFYCETHCISANTRGGRGAWTIEQSAAELGMSKGALVADLELSKYAKVLPEVAKAANKTEALKIIKRVKTGVLNHEAVKQAVEKAQAAGECTCEDGEASKKRLVSLVAELASEYRTRVLLGPMESMLAGQAPFNVVFFDPPWGVDFDEVKMLSARKETYTDSLEAFAAKLRSWLELIYSKMTEDSHLYMKFGIVHHAFVYDMLELVGFKTERIPIIWIKKGQHHTRHAEMWPGRCYEPIAFARKGSKRIVRVGQPNVIVTPPPSPTMKSLHPSAMHPALPKELLFRSCMPGDRVLDPMAGSCMTAVAAESLRTSHMLDYVMIEEKQIFCDLGMKNLLKGYDRIVGEAEVEAESNAKDFRSVVPGGSEWQDIWNKHPELRKEMISFSEGKEPE